MVRGWASNSRSLEFFGESETATMRIHIIALTTALVALGAPLYAQEFTAFVPGGAVARDARIYQKPETGALQAAAREGNVLEAVNPLAPAKYGSGEKYVAYERSDPFKKAATGGPLAFGLRLFAFEY